MVFTQIYIPHSKKSAQWALIISLAVYLAVWGIIGFAFLNEQHKLHSWMRVDAVITSDHEWGTIDTTYEYEIGGKTYSVVKKGLLYEGEKGDKKTLLCPSEKEPKECEFEVDMIEKSGVKIWTKFWLFFSVFPILYAASFIYHSVKEKRKTPPIGHP
ncbi:MAG: hypothetical protein IKZ87_00645 [Actinomycetaceae bacterium]|nr:hypothetical protein [Actinomycetaceae bacterium]